MVKLDASTRTIQVCNFDFHYTADDFVNAESYDFHRQVWGKRDPQAYVIHTYGTVLAIVFPEYYAYSEQDALDQAVNAGKLDSLLITPEELPDYETGKDSEGNPEYEGICYLGNASEPFDSQNLEMFTVPCSLFAADELIAKIIAENPQE